MKIKKGDEVVVTRGKDKGKRGKVEKVLVVAKQVIVGGMNQYKRHKKARSQSEKSEIITITKPLPISNVMVVCTKCNKPTRIGFKIQGEKKVRVCRKCNKEI